MSRKNNTLNTLEMFALGTSVRDEKLVFTDWESAETHFSKMMGRKITRANIKQAALCCNREIATLVKIDLQHNPYAMALQSVRQLRSVVSELERRIENIEAHLKREGV